jgi:methyl coenzyme M reductase subunit C
MMSKWRSEEVKAVAWSDGEKYLEIPRGNTLIEVRESILEERGQSTRFISIKKKANVNGKLRVVSSIALKPEEFEQIKNLKI